MAGIPRARQCEVMITQSIASARPRRSVTLESVGGRRSSHVPVGCAVFSTFRLGDASCAKKEHLRCGQHPGEGALPESTDPTSCKNSRPCCRMQFAAGATRLEITRCGRHARPCRANNVRRPTLVCRNPPSSGRTWPRGRSRFRSIHRSCACRWLPAPGPTRAQCRDGVLRPRRFGPVDW